MAKKNYRSARFLVGSDSDINISRSEYAIQYDKFGSYSLPKQRKHCDEVQRALGVGSLVHHREYGCGQITKMSRGKMKVVFKNDGREVYFAYPFAFEKGILSRNV